ncbi:MAG: sensor histidine kinase [Candidatus Pacebacteria bacterium]|nr:sensor histidine kinase [Candidatus Paceibacterota bacterium]
MRTRYWYWIWKTFLGPSRLRKKFVRNFILVGSLPLILMGAVSVYLINLTHKIDVRALELNIASQGALKAERFVDQVISDINLTVTYEDLAPIKADQYDVLLSGMMKDNLDIVDISLVCTTPDFCSSGYELRRWSKIGESQVVNSNLRNFSTEKSFLTSSGGKIFRSEPELRDGNFYLSALSPIFNTRNQIIGVIYATLDLQKIKESLSELKLGSTGYIYIVSQSGKILSHQNKDLIGKDVSNIAIVSDILKDTSLNFSNNVYYSGVSGNSVSGAGVFINSLNWVAVAEWPALESQSLIRTIFIQVTMFFLATLLIITIFASYVALKLIEPIAEIRQGTSIIGSGDFNYRVSIKTGDELEDLAVNLNKMAEHLKGLEELRDLRLKTEYLSQSLAKEKDLSKLKDQFITTVTHQFNTPLSVINWALDGLRDQDVTRDKINEISTIIAKSQKDIVAIVSDLVTLSEIGFRYQKENDKPLDLFELVKKVTEAFSNSLKIKNIKITLSKSTENSIATINEFTIRKVFENLIDNAIGYSNAGSEVFVDISGTESTLVIKVSDKGIGIPDKDKDSIFQQFYRATNAVAKKNVGTGLGLFICKSIVDGHGGRIWFESKENVETTFFVQIPRGNQGIVGGVVAPKIENKA